MSATAAPPVVDREAEKVARFRKLATQRGNRALKYLDMLARTGDRSRYSYTEEQTDLIVATLRDAVDKVEAAFAGKSDQLTIEL
jgi:hypothetical protein